MIIRFNTKSTLGFTAALAVLAVPGLAGDSSASKPFSRAAATAIIANARKIVTPNGIERLERVRIGGIESSTHAPATKVFSQFSASHNATYGTNDNTDNSHFPAKSISY